MRRSAPRALALLLSILACAPAPAPPAAAPPGATPPATAATAVAPGDSRAAEPGPPPPPPPPEAEGAAEPGPAPLGAAFVVDAAGETALHKDGESLVAPGARFRLDLAAPLADARLSLYDAQEALVASEATTEIGSQSSRLTLAPARPLRPGARYALRIEGASGKELHDLGGSAYRPLALSLRVAGDPPPPVPARRKSHRRQRRR